jgi:hypothetical protein
MEKRLSADARLHTCPYCGTTVSPYYYGHSDYPYRADYGPRMMCLRCDAHVGCHNGDPSKPMGTVANATDRSWRRIIHAKIDPLWKRETGPAKRKARKRMYARLSDALGREAHASWENGAGLLELVDAARLVVAGWER